MTTHILTARSFMINGGKHTTYIDLDETNVRQLNEVLYKPTVDCTTLRLGKLDTRPDTCNRCRKTASHYCTTCLVSLCSGCIEPVSMMNGLKTRRYPHDEHAITPLVNKPAPELRVTDSGSVIFSSANGVNVISFDMEGNLLPCKLLETLSQQVSSLESSKETIETLSQQVSRLESSQASIETLSQRISRLESSQASLEKLSQRISRLESNRNLLLYETQLKPETINNVKV